MGWLRRGRRSPGTGSERRREARADDELTFFGVDEASRFRAVVREVLAEMGLEVQVRPQSVVTDDGREWGLWNVAATAHVDERGEAGWAEVVRDHFARLFLADAQDTSELDDAEFAAALRLRLVEEGPLAQLGLEGYDHALPWAEGVVRLPVLDLPDTVVTLPGDGLRRRGELAGLLDLAWRNTAALVHTEELVRERVEHEGQWIWCVLGSSFFTASLALVLPDLVRRHEPAADLGGGVLLAVPYRHQVAYRVVDSPQAAYAGLVLLPRFAVAGYADAAGPLSPHTYLWRDGEVRALTAFAEDGSLEVTPGPYLEELLGRL